MVIILCAQDLSFKLELPCYVPEHRVEWYRSIIPDLELGKGFSSSNKACKKDKLLIGNVKTSCAIGQVSGCSRYLNLGNDTKVMRPICVSASIL
jgi:hypothetical protein